MARNQKLADSHAKTYFFIKKQIEKQIAEREELYQRLKEKKDVQLYERTLHLTAQIESDYRDLDKVAHMIVDCIYGEEEEDAQIHDD